MTFSLLNLKREASAQNLWRVASVRKRLHLASKDKEGPPQDQRLNTAQLSYPFNMRTVRMDPLDLFKSLLNVEVYFKSGVWGIMNLFANFHIHCESKDSI